jgi:hypothetical protein
MLVVFVANVDVLPLKKNYENTSLCLCLFLSFSTCIFVTCLFGIYKNSHSYISREFTLCQALNRKQLKKLVEHRGRHKGLVLLYMDGGGTSNFRTNCATQDSKSIPWI